MDSQKVLLRALVDNVYDVQAVRIAVGNRLVANLRELGIIKPAAKPGRKSTSQPANGETADEAAAKEKAAEEKENNRVLVEVVKEFNRITDELSEQYKTHRSIIKALESAGADYVYIKTELIYDMVDTFIRLSKSEKSMLDICSREVKKHPMWDAFFKDVAGCGPLMSAVCIAYLDPHKARYASSFWRYAGLDVITDENGSHGRTRSDFVMVKYTNKKGEETERKSLGFNPTVKTKLVGVLGTSFLRTGQDGKYAKLYYEYRNRLENRPDCADLRPVVIHRRAIRYAVKFFLKDMWCVWREIEGLPVGEDYAVAKLGMKPHHDPRDYVDPVPLSADEILSVAGNSNN